MKEYELYAYVIKKAISFGMKPKNYPSVGKEELKELLTEKEIASFDNEGNNVNAVLRHSPKNGAFIGIIDVGQPIYDDDDDSESTNNNETGRYTGLSFVVFTDCNSKKEINKEQEHCIVSIGIGSSSLGQDTGLASKPGFRRSFMNHTKALKGEIAQYFFAENWASMESKAPGLKEYIDRIEDDGEGPFHIAINRFDNGKDRNLLPAACVITLPSGTDNTTLNISKISIPALDAWLAQYAIWRGWDTTISAKKKIEEALRIKQNESKKNGDIKKEIEQLLNEHKYIVLQGAPGCGKTFTANEIAKDYGDNVKFIQFHAETTYADFVYGIKPVLNGKEIAYVGEPGILLQIIEKANNELEQAKKDKRKAEKYLLIIDEINRANLANVLGPVFYLFEAHRKDAQYELTLGKVHNDITKKDEPIKFKEIPENLYVIATMNTADKSLAVVDFALRRRFAWYTLYPRILNDEDLASADKEDPNPHQTVLFFNDNIFNDIASLFNRYATDEELNLQPGHSYFITKSSTTFIEEQKQKKIEWEKLNETEKKEKMEKNEYYRDKIPQEMISRLKYEIMPLMKEYFTEGYLTEAKNEFAQLYYKYTKEYMYK